MPGSKYVIDATMGVRQGLFFLRPAKLDEEGKFMPDPTKPHVLTDTVGDREIVGLHHQDGPEALDAFCEEHNAALRKVLAQFL